MLTYPQLERLGLFDARVPRYTSYPTAPHFKPQVGLDDFTRWVRAIAPRSQISLYIHVPFCRRLCWFCACRTQGSPTAAPVAAYLESLKAELALLSDHLPEGIRLSRLHWGGGTPTLLSPSMIADLAGAIAAALPFAPDAEFSVEIDPNEIDEPRIAALSAAGMNRASLGIQDFDPLIQDAIGRPQSFDATKEAIELLRAQRITSLNADLVYGLPHQTPGRITDTVQKLMSLTPDRIALYGYAHVPWMAKRQQLIPSEALPSPEERLSLFETARRLLVWDGYNEIGIDHFAIPEDGLSIAQKTGQLRRNFQGYTDDTSPVLIGLGASSISRFPEGYAQNEAATSAYTKAIHNHQFATARGHAFSSEDRLRARLIEALMCDFRISASETTGTFGISPNALKQIFAQADAVFPGLLDISQDGLFIPKHVRPLTRMIARCFDAYDSASVGHSSAI